MNLRNVFLILFAFSFNISCSQDEQKQEASFLPEIVKIVKENHLDPKPLDDEMSRTVFKSFLNELDPEKLFFLSSEIEKLSFHESSLDEGFENGSLDFFDEALSIYRKGISRAENNLKLFFDSPLNLVVKEYIETDIEKIKYSESEKNLSKKWRLHLKKHFIKNLWLLEMTKPNLPFEEHKKLALAKIRSDFEDYFYQLNKKTDAKWLESYANTYLSYNDYQSAFMSPESKAEWDAKIQRSMVGVGIYIETTNDYPIIKKVIYDGPAWKSQKIFSGDIIQKIANEKSEMVDVAGFPLNKVIDLLKGDLGTQVSLELKNPNSLVETISIARGPVEMPKTTAFVLKPTINDPNIGYIHLPRFYYGEDSSADNVLQAIVQLKKEKVGGIIFDVRNNQGGSSREAIEIIGYFLKGGPVMQAKYANGNFRVFEDESIDSSFEGKLIVLVNEGSSSASELLAGTLKDYERALIVGNQTFGKGTMQNFLEIIDPADSTYLGEAKLSIASFYTGKGKSTQFHGVEPDVLLPHAKMFQKTGERNIENSLKIEHLQKPNFGQKSEQLEIDTLQKLSEKRIAKSHFFNEVKRKALEAQSKKEGSLMSLDYKSYKNLKKSELNQQKANDKIDAYEVANLKSIEEKDFQKSSDLKRILEGDHYVQEAVFIMLDYLSISS